MQSPSPTALRIVRYGKTKRGAVNKSRMLIEFFDANKGKGYAWVDKDQLTMKKNPAPRYGSGLEPLSRDEIAEVSELWHISRTALASASDRSNYARKLWVSKEFSKITDGKRSPTAVYKLMERHRIGDFTMNPKKRAVRKKTRTPAQRAATARMLAANRARRLKRNPTKAVPRKPRGIGDYMKHRRKSFRHMTNATRTESYMSSKFKYCVQVLRNGKWITLARFETKAMALEYGRSKQRQYPSKTFQIHW